MKQPKNKKFRTIGMVVVGALLIGCGSALVQEYFTPKIYQVFIKPLEDYDSDNNNDNVIVNLNDDLNSKVVATADGYIVTKIQDEDETKNESDKYIVLNENGDLIHKIQ